MKYENQKCSVPPSPPEIISEIDLLSVEVADLKARLELHLKRLDPVIKSYPKESKCSNKVNANSATSSPLGLKISNITSEVKSCINDICEIDNFLAI